MTDGRYEVSQTGFLCSIDWRIGRIYAAVLPEPVLERAGRSESVISLSLKLIIIIPSMSLPSRASGITLDWTSVGAEKFCCATAWRSRESRPRALKSEGFLDASFEATAVGTSSSSSLRFMIAMDCKDTLDRARTW